MIDEYLPADHADAALLALRRELEMAIAAEDALGVEAGEAALAAANGRVWRAIEAITDMAARTPEGVLVKARAVARAYRDNPPWTDADAGADERALGSLVRDLCPGRSSSPASPL